MPSKFWTPGLITNVPASVGGALQNNTWNDPHTILESPEEKMMKEFVKNKVLSQAPSAVKSAPQSAPVAAPPVKSVEPQAPAGEFNIGELLMRTGGLLGDVIKGDTENKTQGAITGHIQSGLAAREKKEYGKVDSEISNRYRDIASKLFPGQDFSKWAAADYDKFAPIVEKIYMEKSARQIVPGNGVEKGGQDVMGFEPIGGVNIDKTKIQKASEISSNLASTMPILQKAINKYGQVANSPLGGIASQFTDPEFQSIKNGLSGLLRLAIVGPGTLSDSDRKIIQSVIDDPVPSRAMEKLKSVSERTILGAEGAARGYGFKPASNYNYLVYGNENNLPTTKNEQQTAKSSSIGQQVVGAGQKLAESVAKVSPTAQATQPIRTIRNKKTGEMLQSTDGGKTWQPIK